MCCNNIFIYILAYYYIRYASSLFYYCYYYYYYYYYYYDIRYTSAGFSGRMPMAELADAIVSSGRATLEWAIQYIRNKKEWNADVVYGDTDSMFVHVPGRTLEQAIKLGNQIADEITSKCPDNVVLKYEKVYWPCILASKKRYVGAAYEKINQVVPHFDAKVLILHIVMTFVYIHE